MATPLREPLHAAPSNNVEEVEQKQNRQRYAEHPEQNAASHDNLHFLFTQGRDNV